MSSASGPVRLRLVGQTPPASRPRAISEAEARARAEIARENHAAAGLSATDARWVVAVRTAEALEGGRLGILRPEKRRNIGLLATRLGLREFDANLIMAIVQDSARSGAAGGALGVETADRLRLVRGGGNEAGGEELEGRGEGAAARLLLCAILLGLLMVVIAVRWVLG